MSAHTSGPWHNLGTAIGLAYQGQGGERDQFIEIAVLPDIRDWDAEEWKANARLIAAAPDLYREAFELIGNIDPESDDRRFDGLRAALAKVQP